MDKFVVELWEYEKGWGSKKFDESEFDTEELADAYAKEINDENNLPVTPDYYIIAKKKY